MNYYGGIRGDDSIVDVETVTDTAWSVEMPGRSIQSISSVSALISTEPLLVYQNMNIRNNLPVDIPIIDIPIAGSYRMKKIPSRKPGQIRVNQVSRLNSKTDNSAARCFVILGKEPKLLSDKKLTKAQTHPKYTQVCNSVRRYISAATSATTTVRSTRLSRCAYIRNPAVRAVDKEGSHQHYLHRKIKRLMSTIATYAHNVEREIRLLHFALDSYLSDLDHEFTLVKSKVGSNDYESQLKLLSSKFESSNLEMIRRGLVIQSTLKSYADDLVKKITLLNSKVAPYAHDLGMQITLMNSKINSFYVDLRSKLKIMFSKSSRIADHVRREYNLLMSERVVV